MMHWPYLVTYLGDAGVMLPAAAGIFAWIAALPAWRLAALWLLAFVGACAVIAASKIAFMGWGWEMPQIGYKAMSGHAMLSSAVLPVAGKLALSVVVPRQSRLGAAAGVALSIAMAVFLVAYDYHTLSETVAGWLVGMAASAPIVRRLSLPSASPVRRWLPVLCLLVFALIWQARPAVAKLWMVEAALHFSGRSAPYR